MPQELTQRQRLLKELIAERDRTKSVLDRIKAFPEDDIDLNHFQSMNGICASMANNHEVLLREYYKITKPVD